MCVRVRPLAYGACPNWMGTPDSLFLVFLVVVVMTCCLALTMHLAGASTDYLVIGSDSGKIVILEWVNDSNNWKRVHEETFGKTGCRRICPGQFLAVDPKGRAIIIGAWLCVTGCVAVAILQWLFCCGCFAVAGCVAVRDWVCDCGCVTVCVTVCVSVRVTVWL